MSDTTHLKRDAVAALNRGAYEEAAERLQKLLLAEPRNADGWFLMGMVAAANFRISKALELVDQAIELKPDDAEYLAQKAKLHALLDQTDAAREAADRADAAAPDNALTMDTIGVVYSKIGAYADAVPLLERAVAAAPDNAQFHFNLASAEQFLGRAADAADHYEEAIRLEPRFYRAYWARAELGKNDRTPRDPAPLEAQLATPGLGADDQLYLAHALATEYEKADEYDKAFNVLELAKRRRTEQITYSAQTDERLFEAIKRAFPVTADYPVSGTGGEAIFVTGMPRTGTTLIERILDSHPEASSLGELQAFAAAVKRASQTSSRVMLDEDVILAAPNADAKAIASDYLQAVRARGHAGGRFIDKMPLNFLYIGYILRALPAAKVVVLRRNPLDTVMSNFRQLFAIHFSYYNYHYDLMDTALYYVQFHKLMAHWQELFGARIHNVSYETLTGAAEQETRALLDYAGLPWDPACLYFHDNPGAVATASTMQVREPIYRRAVARWKKYESHLGDVKRLFDRHDIAYD